MDSKDEIKINQLEKENRELKRFVEKMYIVGIRILFSVKQLIRIGALCGCYFWKGKEATFALAGVIILIILIQSGINRLKTIIKPNLHSEFDEWDFII